MKRKYSWLILVVRTCNTHSDVKQKNKEVKITDPNPNNSYKTKKNFTGSYSEVNPYGSLTLIVRDFLDFCFLN